MIPIGPRISTHFYTEPTINEETADSPTSQSSSYTSIERPPSNRKHATAYLEAINSISQLTQAIVHKNINRSVTSKSSKSAQSNLEELLAKDDTSVKNVQSLKFTRIYTTVQKELEVMARERLNLIAERPKPFRPELRIKSAEDRQDAEMLPSILLRLVKDIEDDEKPLNLLKKIATQNFNQNIFSYRINKYRDPFDMVRHRDGDCSSFTQLFTILGRAAGIKNLSTVELSGDMKFTLSEKPEIPNLRSGESVEFARHTILAIPDQDSNKKLYFDPVFGCQVEPSHYGSDLNSYLKL